MPVLCRSAALPTATVTAVTIRGLVIPLIVIRLDVNRLVVMVVEVTVMVVLVVVMMAVMVMAVMVMAMMMVLVMMPTTMSAGHACAAQHQDRRDHCQNERPADKAFHKMPPWHKATALGNSLAAVTSDFFSKRLRPGSVTRRFAT